MAQIAVLNNPTDAEVQAFATNKLITQIAVQGNKIYFLYDEVAP